MHICWKSAVSMKFTDCPWGKHSLVCCVTRNRNLCQVTLINWEFVSWWVLRTIVCIFIECSRQTAFQFYRKYKKDSSICLQDRQKHFYHMFQKEWEERSCFDGLSSYLGQRLISVVFYAEGLWCIARHFSAVPSDAHERNGGGTHRTATSGCESLLVSARRGVIQSLSSYYLDTNA
jgi:hypothetical protein